MLSQVVASWRRSSPAPRVSSPKTSPTMFRRPATVVVRRWFGSGVFGCAVSRAALRRRAPLSFVSETPLLVVVGKRVGFDSVARALTPSLRPPLSQPRERLVILGTGWGATSVLKTIDASKYDVTVVSPRNYFLMTALLPGVTVGTVEGRSIVENVRRLLPGDGRFYEATAVDVDPVAKTVTCVDRSPLTVDFPNEPFLVPYDRLVVSVGAPFNTFRVPGVDKHAIKVKEVEDALAVRSRLMDMLETASLPGVDDETRRRVCSVVVVGGGPYGVNIAAEISDFLRQDAPRLYPELRGVPSVTILSSQDHILSVYDERISRFAEEKFERDAIRVLKGRVPRCSPRNCACGTSDGRDVSRAVRRVRRRFSACTRWCARRRRWDTKSRSISVDSFLRVMDAEGVYRGDCADVKEAAS